MTSALVVLAMAALLWPGSRGQVTARLRRLRPPPASTRSSPPPDDPVRSRRRRWVLAGSAGAAAGLVVGGGAGLLAAAVVAVGAERLLRAAATTGMADDGAAIDRDLPVACDLLGVCLAAGLPVDGALAAVGSAMPGPLGPRLVHVAALSRLGAEPRRAWAGLPVELAPLGRVLVRAGESGATAADALARLAADRRTALRAETEAGVRRAGVWVLAPLGLCFLPAFVCLGVVPLVLGIAADVLG
ncbi:type II secretion system F family protein [Blastococcus sp. CCUG 61487]|uniref:type II secretion system F family protein n=1 Tax=Blastococcus sp. CCUG 61487 TaxID=1840703 RepID=UPI0010C13590|nr:type II secretion system F family protein [Blastococcus sp. CCUG 61487]TKJ31950.1 type II secretion protein F [Blastococcus sp. CCUG 61487]